MTQKLLNDEILIAKILSTFNNVAPGTIETLRFAIEAENYELAQEQARSLKSAASTICATNLERLASNLENCFINNDYSHAPDIFQKLEEEYNKVQREIFIKK